MNAGLRTYKHASCRVHAPTSVPEHLQGQVRELISLRSDNQGNGEARDLMHRVCKEADHFKMVLMLTAKPFEAGIPEDKLKSFYKRFGFFVASDKAPDVMVRAPRKLH